MRPSKGEQDFAAILELARAVPESNPHIIDLPWRISTPVTASEQDACVWEDENGVLHGFAAWQYWWAALDYYIRPGSHQQEIEEQMYSVMERRFRELDVERGNRLPYWIEFRDDDVERKDTAEQHGYTLKGDYYYVQMQHLLLEPLAEARLPAGFTLRPLAGMQEVEAYVALHRAAFESTSMTVEWRRRTLLTPSYNPELDLVVVAPGTTLVGFCVGWLDSYRTIGQIEPIGVHPSMQGMGLGNVLLHEILRRFKDCGAKTARVETNGDRIAAIRAYESVGFQVAHKVLRRGKYA
jgi:ribosomal protein S18 acetylase RimI-like enzyme